MNKQHYEDYWNALQYSQTLPKEQRDIFLKGFNCGCSFIQLQHSMTIEENYKFCLALGLKDEPPIKAIGDYVSKKEAHEKLVKNKKWWQFWIQPADAYERMGWMKEEDGRNIPKPLSEGTTKNCGVNPSPTCARPDIDVPATKPQPPKPPENIRIKESEDIRMAKERNKLEKPGTTVWEEYGAK